MAVKCSSPSCGISLLCNREPFFARGIAELTESCQSRTFIIGEFDSKLNLIFSSAIAYESVEVLYRLCFPSVFSNTGM